MAMDRRQQKAEENVGTCLSACGKGSQGNMKECLKGEKGRKPASRLGSFETCLLKNTEDSGGEKGSLEACSSLTQLRWRPPFTVWL
jgi:hypothetical protein